MANQINYPKQTFGGTNQLLKDTLNAPAGAPVIETFLNGQPLANNPYGNPLTTEISRPVVTGYSSPGAVIKLLDGGAVVGSTVVQPDGQWSVSPAADLGNGSHSFSVSVTVANGMSYESKPVFFNVHLTSPADISQQAVVTSVGGEADGGTIVSAKPVITGTAEANVHVYVYDGGQLIGITLSSSEGKWSFTPSDNFSDSHQHSITALAVDSLDRPGVMSAPLVVTSDSGAVIPTPEPTPEPTPTPTPEPTPDNLPVIPGQPVITSVGGEAMNHGTTHDAKPVITGTADANTSVHVYDNGTQIGITTSDAEGKWSFTPAQDMSGPSEHWITAMAFSDAGRNGYPSMHFYVTVDANGTTPVPTPDNLPIIPNQPVITSIGGELESHGTTHDAKPVITGTADANTSVHVYFSGVDIGSTMSDAKGNWSFTPAQNLSGSAENWFTAVAFSDIGYNGTPSTRFYVTIDSADTKPVPVPDPTPDPAPVVDIPHQAVITSVGGVNNGGTTHDAKPVITGTADAGVEVRIYDNLRMIGSTVSKTDGTWSFTPDVNLSDAHMHSITATAYDQFGRSNAPSQPVNVLVDVHGTVPVPVPEPTPEPAPVVDIPHQAVITSVGGVNNGGTTHDAKPVITGTADAGVEVRIYDNLRMIGSTVSKTDGTWSFTPEVSLSDAHMHSITATAYDQFGRSNAPSQPVNVLVDVHATVPVPEPTPVPDVPHQAVITSVGGVTNGGKISSSTPVISGTADADVNVYIFDGGRIIGMTVAGHDGSWAYTSAETLAGGMHTISAAAVTPSGQFGQMSEPLVVAIDSNASMPAHITDSSLHTVVGDHDVFFGHYAGNETVDLTADAARYFSQFSAHIAGSQTGAADTLHLVGDHQYLDLNSLTGTSSAAKLSGIEVIDLGGKSNTLKLSTADVLNLGEMDLFMRDGHKQMMVKGSAADTVDLSSNSLYVPGVADGYWASHGQAQVDGVSYQVFEHSGTHAELLVQQNVHVIVH